MMFIYTSAHTQEVWVNMAGKGYVCNRQHVTHIYLICFVQSRWGHPSSRLSVRHSHSPRIKLNVSVFFLTPAHLKPFCLWSGTSLCMTLPKSRLRNYSLVFNETSTWHGQTATLKSWVNRNRLDYKHICWHVTLGSLTNLMRNYNMWPRAHKESCNYTQRQNRRETTTACVSKSASSSKRFPLSLLDKNTFRMGHTLLRCSLIVCSGRNVSAASCSFLSRMWVCAQTDWKTPPSSFFLALPGQTAFPKAKVSNQYPNGLKWADYPGFGLEKPGLTNTPKNSSSHLNKSQ